jgi:hypothetical protein
LSFSLLPVTDRPFPHVVVDDYLPADLYARLTSTFPECPANSGPTGFSCFWGDEEYAALLESEPAWSTLFAMFHGQAFVDYCLAQFAQTFRDEATVDLTRGRYVPYLETRADKQLRRLPATTLTDDDLWVRVDVLQGRTGYGRGRHVDHRRRAVSMLIYCCDADENGMEGGDLVLHGPLGGRTSIRPRHNRMVAFPCPRTSFHSVTPITSQNSHRNFVQVTLSGCGDLWRKPLVEIEEALLAMRHAASRAKRVLTASAV